MGEIDKILDLLEQESRFKRKIKLFFTYHQSWFIVPLLFIGIILLALAINSITLPYIDYTYETEEVLYTEIIPTEKIIPVEVTKKIEILKPVNKTVTQRRKETIIINECNFVDPEYTYDYAGDLKKIDIRTYDFIKSFGYDLDRYYQSVFLCTNETEDFWLEYEVCRFYDLEEIDCDFSTKTNIKANDCTHLSNLIWHTSFDTKKDIIFRVLDVQKIEKCADVEKEIEVGKAGTRVKRTYEKIYEYITKVENQTITENETVIRTKEVTNRKEVIKKDGILTVLFRKLFT